jgi:hypothetical protein
MAIELTALAVLHLVILTGPDGQVIQVNPDTVITVRPPRGNEHFHPEIKCLIHTADGKIVTVTEDCDTVRERLEE